MVKGDGLDKYLPLSESTYYILLALVEPLHGYGIMQKVTQVSHGAVNIGPGTLYGAFSVLEEQKLIIKVGEVDRRKTYALTDKGRQVLVRQIERITIMAENGQQALARLSEGLQSPWDNS